MPAKVLARRLARLGERLLPLRPFERLRLDGRPRLSFVCDDGRAEDLDKLAPVFAAAGVPASFAVTSGLVGAPGYMGAADLRALCAAGHEISCHMDRHEPVAGLDAAELAARMARADAALGVFPGYTRCLVYPYGDNSRRVRQEAARRFACGVSAWPGLNAGLANRFALRRMAFGSYLGRHLPEGGHYLGLVEQAARRGAWLIFMLHAAHPDHDRAQGELLAAVLDRAGELGLPVQTLAQALRDTGA